MKTNNYNFDWEKEIVRNAIWAIDPEAYCGYCYKTVVELPCEVTLSKIYEVNREFTNEVYAGKNMPAIGYVKYPLTDGKWVLQRIHGNKFPNEWRNAARPEGLVSLYLEPNPNLKHDRAVFLTEEDCNRALEKAINPWWDSETNHYCDRNSNGEKIILSYERDPYMSLSWNSLGKEEFKNKRAE